MSHLQPTVLPTLSRTKVNVLLSPVHGPVGLETGAMTGAVTGGTTGPVGVETGAMTGAVTGAVIGAVTGAPAILMLIFASVPMEFTTTVTVLPPNTAGDVQVSPAAKEACTIDRCVPSDDEGRKEAIFELALLRGSKYDQSRGGRLEI